MDGSPRMCMPTQPAPASAATAHKDADTSLRILAAQLAHHRYDASQFLAFGHFRRAGPGGLSPDVNYVGALFGHCAAAPNGSFLVHPETTVVERVRGYIEHAHH